jgi:hypothetical protein
MKIERENPAELPFRRSVLSSYSFPSVMKGYGCVEFAQDFYRGVLDWRCLICFRASCHFVPPLICLDY